ncbi:hypothetical protein E4U41_004271 [Claviceps citrina]|nr:hypothetical protein E4U41_004271 [Claviceps citrina]
MASRKKPRKRKSKWSADNILTDPRSPLATADLRSVLTHPLAWTSLTLEERRHVLSLFPDAALILDADTDGARPDFETLINDDAFRADCAAYVENLAQGRHDPQWLRDAWRAHGRRKAGDFDDFLISKFEGDWGPLPEHMRLEARTSKAGGEEAGPASGGASSGGASSGCASGSASVGGDAGSRPGNGHDYEGTDDGRGGAPGPDAGDAGSKGPSVCD